MKWNIFRKKKQEQAEHERTLGRRTLAEGVKVNVWAEGTRCPTYLIGAGVILPVSLINGDTLDLIIPVHRLSPEQQRMIKTLSRLNPN